MAGEALTEAYRQKKRLWRDEDGQLHYSHYTRNSDLPDWIPGDRALEAAIDKVRGHPIATALETGQRIAGSAVRDAGVGLATTATDIAGRPEWSDKIRRNVPVIDTANDYEAIGSVLGQYIVPGMGAAKVVTKLAPALKAMKGLKGLGTRAVGWGLADAAVTDPKNPNNQFYTYDPEASDLRNKLGAGAEGAAFVGGFGLAGLGLKGAWAGAKRAGRAIAGRNKAAAVADDMPPPEKVDQDLIDAVKDMELRSFRNSQAAEGASFDRAGRGVDKKAWHTLRNAQRQKLVDDHIAYIKANNGVTNDELNAVKTFFGYGEVARGDKNIKLVESFIDKTPPSPGRVYRHTTGSKNSAIWKLKEGDTHSFGDITSTSLRPDINKAKAGSTFGKHRFVIDHNSGRDVSKLGMIDEYEVLIPKGAKFRVESVADEGGIRIIHLKEI